ncbi:MAG: Gfo/Idh/MocA family oxidoreductase [Clostridiales bacterium]|nr:Gfo/Idh/MocA family oxidoreductase [Clostridiales bacterium]
MLQEDRFMDRRSFIKKLGGVMGLGSLMAAYPWLEALGGVEDTGRKCRLALIGCGSRGCFHLSFLKNNPLADVKVLCDTYDPSLDQALKLIPDADTEHDYRRVLERNDVDAVVIATPLHTHCAIALDAMDAGKDVLCEKCIGYTADECKMMYDKHIETGRVFFTGQQRLFDPRYIKAMAMIHEGTFGQINAIKAYWNRNGDWRRYVPDPSLERQINWRLYAASSHGLMTELACHQLQVGTWALGKLPEKVMGHGAVTYWKDGREVYDNVSCIYVFDDGVKMTYDSVISNKYYGLEEQILGSLGTVEPEKGKYYFEEIPPSPAFLRLINDWEHKAFDNMPFAGTSWAPEVSSTYKGHYILGEAPKGDGTSQMLEAFVNASLKGEQPANIAEEGYYASVLCLLGHQAIQEEATVYFPEKYKIDYTPDYYKKLQS